MSGFKELDSSPMHKIEFLKFKFAEEDMPPIHHGNAITDRRSTFQAHLAPVVSPKQVSKM